jgi:hypothetical protein
MNSAAERDRLGNTCTYSYDISPSISTFALSFSNSKGLPADLSSCYSLKILLKSLLCGLILFAHIDFSVSIKCLAQTT